MMSKRKSRSRRKSQSSKPKPLVDIIIPFFGDIEFAEKAAMCVDEACDDIPYRITMVDNGSPNQVGRELFGKLKEQGLEFREHWLKRNMGFPGGVNAGMHIGNAPLLFILTADVVMDPLSIKHAVKEMDDPDVGIVGAKLIFPEGSPHGAEGKVQHAGLAMNLPGQVFHIFIGWSADHPKVNIRREMYAVTGAAFMTRRNLFRKIGGFDTAYGLGTFEDVEYCVRLRHLGKKVIYNPLVSGTHHVGGATVAGANAGGFALQQNQQLFRARNQHALEWDEWRHW